MPAALKKTASPPLPPSRIAITTPSLGIPEKPPGKVYTGTQPEQPVSPDASISKPPTSQDMPKPVSSLVLVPADQLPAFSDDMDMTSLDSAIDRSLQYYDRAAGNVLRQMGDALITVREQKDALLALREILRSGEPEEVRNQRIRETFDVYQSTGSDGKKNVLFTGYFEPIMDGSLGRTEECKYPIYKSPDGRRYRHLGRFRGKVQK